MRMSGGVRSIWARSRCGVSPVRIATLMSPPIPRSGARRLRSMSYESAFSGDTYTSRVLRSPSGGGGAVSRSSPQRNAASVLPEPVGADSSTSSPRAIGGQACSWAAVGRSKARRNQSRTCGVNVSRAAEDMELSSVPLSSARLLLPHRAPGHLAGLAAELRAVAPLARRLQRELAVRLARRELARHVERVLRAVGRAGVLSRGREGAVLVHARADDVRVGVSAAAPVAAEVVMDPHALDALRVTRQLERDRAAVARRARVPRAAR